MGRRLSAPELAVIERGAEASRAAKARWDAAWGRRERCCAAPGCSAIVKPTWLFCPRHWFALPRDLRRSIVLTFHHRMPRDYGQLFSQAIVLLEQRGGAA